MGARKNPIKLAKRIGVKGLNPVSFVKSKVVLTGVRVTAAFSAAIVQIIARTGFSPGSKMATALPTHAPVKNMGMINPPRHPPVSVKLTVTNLAPAIAKRKTAGKLLVITSFSCSSPK